VLAHELAHVACAHTLETASVHYALRQTAIVCLGLIGLDGFLSATTSSLARALVSSAHSRTCETEADFVGLEFMRHLAAFDGRYDERAALSAWAAMLETEKGTTSITPAWTHSHPQTENRMNNFEHWLRVGDLRAYAAARNGRVAVAINE
jgi:Zn-dependent protease with chaperone function